MKRSKKRNETAPGCLAQNKGRYFFLKADILLAAIRGKTAKRLKERTLSMRQGRSVLFSPRGDVKKRKSFLQVFHTFFTP